MKELDLQLFDDEPAEETEEETTGHSVTVYKDGNITTATADKTENVAAEETVTLTITPATGKVLDAITVLAGGVTVNAQQKFEMPDADVVIYVTGRADMSKKYIVTEPCTICINDAKTELVKNVTVNLTKTGGIWGVTVDGTTIESNDVVMDLIASGVLKKIEE